MHSCLFSAHTYVRMLQMYVAISVRILYENVRAYVHIYNFVQYVHLRMLCIKITDLADVYNYATYVYLYIRICILVRIYVSIYTSGSNYNSNT